MNLEAAREMAVRGRLYPSVILHGATEEARREAALELAARLLCERPGSDEEGECRHCRRLRWPGEGEGFHPDFEVLERDLKTATSVEATKAFLLKAQVTPFEARGQVFVVAAADTLSEEAANALLKSLEEPHLSSPRHFLLLAPSQFDLLATLRSRSMAVFLGADPRPSVEELSASVEAFSNAVTAYARSSSSADLLAAAAVLFEAAEWKDARAGEPWTRTAAIVRHAADTLPAEARRAAMELALDLLDGIRLRLRGVPARRILDGLTFEHLA